MFVQKVIARLFKSYVDMTLNSNQVQTHDAYIGHMGTKTDITLTQYQVRHMFANNSSTNKELYPPTISEITEAQTK